MTAQQTPAQQPGSSGLLQQNASAFKGLLYGGIAFSIAYGLTNDFNRAAGWGVSVAAYFSSTSGLREIGRQIDEEKKAKAYKEKSEGLVPSMLAYLKAYLASDVIGGLVAAATANPAAGQAARAVVASAGGAWLGRSDGKRIIQRLNQNGPR